MTLSAEFEGAKSQDIDRIRKLAIPIFTESFKKILTPEQNEYMLDMMYSPTKLETELQRGCQYYILKYNGQDAGYTSIELIDKPSATFKLHKIYLMHSMHGKGLGKLQLQYMEKMAKDQGAKQMKLCVNRNNPATEFYKSQGWTIISSEDFDIGNGFYMNDYVLHKDLH